MGLVDRILTQMLTNNFDDKGCEWLCDSCGTSMNNQPGFSTASGIWICTNCSHLNDVTEANINHYGSRPFTQEQSIYIKQIEDLLGVSFYGVTLEEASDFIDEYRDRYQAKLHTPYKYR